MAFATLFQLGDAKQCIDLLVKTQRAPEAALFARTYAPRLVRFYRSCRIFIDVMCVFIAKHLRPLMHGGVIWNQKIDPRSQQVLSILKITLRSSMRVGSRLCQEKRVCQQVSFLSHIYRITRLKAMPIQPSHLHNQQARRATAFLSMPHDDRPERCGARTVLLTLFNVKNLEAMSTSSNNYCGLL